MSINNEILLKINSIINNLSKYSNMHSIQL